MKTTYDLKTSVIAFEWSADEQEKMTDEVKQDALDLVKFVAEGLKDVIHPMQSLHSSKNKSGICYMIESRDTNTSYANYVVPDNYLAISKDSPKNQWDWKHLSRFLGRRGRRESREGFGS